MNNFKNFLDSAKYNILTTLLFVVVILINSSKYTLLEEKYHEQAEDLAVMIVKNEHLMEENKKLCRLLDNLENNPPVYVFPPIPPASEESADLPEKYI